jgi:hypothetical protein
MEVISTSETSGNFYEAALSNSPEDSNIHTRCRENLKSHFYEGGDDGGLSTSETSRNFYEAT